MLILLLAKQFGGDTGLLCRDCSYAMKQYPLFLLQLLCWCSRSLPAVAAATAAVAVMDALIPDTGRAKSAQLPIHEVTQPAIEDMPGHHDLVLWE